MIDINSAYKMYKKNETSQQTNNNKKLQKKERKKNTYISKYIRYTNYSDMFTISNMLL